MVVGPTADERLNKLSKGAKLKKALMRDGKVALPQPFPGIAVDFLKRNMGVSENVV